jgi:TetR/AcrR family transcriptional regulator, transcriptional repressor for nem operon
MEYIEREPDAAACLARGIGQTISGNSEQIRQKVQAFFSLWESDLINVFNDARHAHTL